MQNLIIIGAGGFGRECMVYAQEQGTYPIKGFLDSRTDVLQSHRSGFEIIGNPNTYVPEADDVFFCAVGNPADRKHYASLIYEKGGIFINIHHPKCDISQYADIGMGNLCALYVSVSPDAHIGKFVCLNSYVSVGHDVQIGDYCHINGHSSIAGGAKIGTGVTIHPGCVILPNTKIGDNVIVGAGSIVLGHIPPDITIRGNPATKFTFTDK